MDTQAVPLTENKPEFCSAIIEKLNLPACFTIAKLFFKFGRVSVHFLSSTYLGNKGAAFLKYLRIISSNSVIVDDFYLIEHKEGQHWGTNIRVLEACRAQLDMLENLATKFFPNETKQVTKQLGFITAQTWMEHFKNPNYLSLYANFLAKKSGISPDRIFVIAPFVSLAKKFNLMFYPEIKIQCLQPLFKNECVWFYLISLYISFFNLISKPSKVSNKVDKIGFSAAWGIKEIEADQTSMLDDFFWCRGNNIATESLVYMFDHPMYCPTIDLVRGANTMGLQTVALDSRFSGEVPEIVLKKRNMGTLRERWKSFYDICERIILGLFLDEISQSALAIMNYQYTKALKLSGAFKAINLKGVFHYKETGPDFVSLGASFSDAVRIGTHWSTLNTVCPSGFQAHPVFFAWGQHQARIYQASGSIAEHLLIAGCVVNDQSHEQERQKAKEFACKAHERNGSYILALFDCSGPAPNFIRFFFEWLIEDSKLYLLVKPKSEENIPILQNELIQKAKATGRLCILGQNATPADAALFSDFSIAIGSYSALVISALQGARVIYLDHEQMNKGPQGKYCTLHNLGPNRCAFYDLESIKSALLQYFDDPQSNPNLGDASSVLDEFDPFRDGKAGERIGEYASWYLEGLSKGLNRDGALQYSTRKYAHKWGFDKVICGLKSLQKKD